LAGAFGAWVRVRRNLRERMAKRLKGPRAVDKLLAFVLRSVRFLDTKIQKTCKKQKLVLRDLCESTRRTR
jgi:hypothetical protein